jgi:hypothetical protein
LKGNFRKKTIYAAPSFISGKFHEIFQKDGYFGELVFVWRGKEPHGGDVAAVGWGDEVQETDACYHTKKRDPSLCPSFKKRANVVRCLL